MKIKETKIATYTESGCRLQFVKITNYDIANPREYIPGKAVYTYQIRKNRRRIFTTSSEFNARKYFTTIIQNDILQLKIQ